MLGKRSSSNISGSRQLVTCDHCGKENIERRKLKEHTSANHGNSDPRERLSKNQPKPNFWRLFIEDMDECDKITQIYFTKMP